jgi:hypothetical protein
MSTQPIPERLALAVGLLPAPGTLPEPHPFETLSPLREGFVERDGVRSWYAQYGASGPWLAQRALRAMHEPVAYRAVETDGAARAAKEIVSVMENRAWATG